MKKEKKDDLIALLYAILIMMTIGMMAVGIQLENNVIGYTGLILTVLVVSSFMDRCLNEIE